MQNPLTPKGFFVAFEGGEGTGKTTQIRLLEAKIREAGREVLVTFEPGGTPLGGAIRSLLLNPESGAIDPRCEALLYAAARAEHVAKVIRPALCKGQVVLCDRYVDASKAYQGAARGLGVGPVSTLNDWATDCLYPDRVFLFDLDPKVGLDRARKRATDGVLDRMEQEALPFHEKLRQAYLFMARSEPARYRIIDASKEPDALSALLWEEVKGLL